MTKISNLQLLLPCFTSIPRPKFNNSKSDQNQDGDNARQRRAYVHRKWRSNSRFHASPQSIQNNPDTLARKLFRLAVAVSTGISTAITSQIKRSPSTGKFSHQSIFKPLHIPFGWTVIALNPVFDMQHASPQCRHFCFMVVRAGNLPPTIAPARIEPHNKKTRKISSHHPCASYDENRPFLCRMQAAHFCSLDRI